MFTCIKHLAVHRIVKIGDLISDNGIFPSSFSKLMGNINSIRKEWQPESEE